MNSPAGSDGSGCLHAACASDKAATGLGRARRSIGQRISEISQYVPRTIAERSTARAPATPGGEKTEAYLAKANEAILAALG